MYAFCNLDCKDIVVICQRLYRKDGLKVLLIMRSMAFLIFKLVILIDIFDEKNSVD